jgi:cytochrome c553
LRLVVLAPGGLVITLALAILAAYAVSEMKVDARVPLRDEPLTVPTDIASIQHGQHIAGAITLCATCHGSNLAGAVIENDNYAMVVAPNITRASGLRALDYARAIRDGVGPSGRVLWSMPSDEYNRMDDADLAAVIAYLQSLPPVPSNLPASAMRPLGRVLLDVGRFPLIPAASIDRSAPAPAPVTPAATAQYGQYLVQLAGCARCHGPGLSGASVPGAPPKAVAATNLTPAALGAWSEADFVRAMRSGRRPDNVPIDTLMPWPYYAQMTDLELRAIWEFLGAIPARPTGTG